MVEDGDDKVEEPLPLEDEEDEEDVELEESEFVDESPEDGEGVEDGKPWVEEDEDEDGLGVSCVRVGEAREDDDPAPPDELGCATSEAGLELGLTEIAWRLSNHRRFSSAS